MVRRGMDPQKAREHGLDLLEANKIQPAPRMLLNVELSQALKNEPGAKGMSVNESKAIVRRYFEVLAGGEGGRFRTPPSQSSQQQPRGPTTIAQAPVHSQHDRCGPPLGH